MVLARLMVVERDPAMLAQNIARVATVAIQAIREQRAISGELRGDLVATYFEASKSSASDQSRKLMGEVMATDARTEAFRQRIRTRRREPVPSVDLRPASAYEVVTRQMVESLARDLREIKERLNGLLWMVAGTILAEIVLRLIASSR